MYRTDTPKEAEEYKEFIEVLQRSVQKKWLDRKVAEFAKAARLPTDVELNSTDIDLGKLFQRGVYVVVSLYHQAERDFGHWTVNIGGECLHANVEISLNQHNVST